jgi:thimet oligopeptidase
MYELLDNNTGYILGYFYLDLFPRKGKYSGAAEYTIISGKRLDAGYQKPIASLVCNFSAPNQGKPSLLLHEEVETLFHEFGHLLHELLTTTELVSQSGTSVAMDFVEMPSQIFENWVWNKKSLNLFAKHYKTGELIPEDLLESMIEAKKVQSGNNLLQQIFYASLDLTYFDGFKPIDNYSTTKIVEDLQNQITLYSFTPGTHQQAAFDHLIDYGTSYYGYLWSEVYAQDMYSVFQSEGILNPEIGARFRKIIFEPGSSIEPIFLIKEFLGRELDNKPFLIRQGI